MQDEKQISALNSIFDTAEAFKKASNLIGWGIAQGDVLDAPLVVNIAFTLESYFKCINIIENGSYEQEHDLDKLFVLLNKESQEQITKKFDDLVLYDPVIKATPGIELNIKSILKEIADSLVEWRNCSEKSPANFPQGVHLVVATRQRILELKPDLIAN